MCRIITKRRLEYYRGPHYDRKPLFKEGDIVWLYQEPLGKGTGVWLVYEAKIRKPLAAMQYQFDTFFQLGASMPVYDVELPWTSDPNVSSEDDAVPFVGPPVMRSIQEIHLFDPKTILVDEMLCSIGDSNVRVLSGLSEAKKRKVPKEGLLFLGRSQSAEVRKHLERTGQNEHANCAADMAHRAGQNKPSDVWKGHGKKRRTKQFSTDLSLSKPRVTFSTEKFVMDNGVIVRVQEEPEDSPPHRRKAVQAARTMGFSSPVPRRGDTDSDSIDHVPSSSSRSTMPKGRKSMAAHTEVKEAEEPTKDDPFPYEWEIESILKKRKITKGSKIGMQYCVTWKGYDNNRVDNPENWVFEDQLRCDELLDEFNKREILTETVADDEAVGSDNDSTLEDQWEV